MTSWLDVFRSGIEVSVPYLVCTIFWIIGLVGILAFTVKRQRDFQKSMLGAVLLFDNVYQTGRIAEPCITGFFRPRIYLPEGFSAREMKNILLHQQLHCERWDSVWRGMFFVITCLHWCNPCCWLAYYLSGIDMEISCDEALIRRIGWGRKAEYAQDILNMKKERMEDYIPGSLVSFQEKNLSLRAQHMLYMEVSPLWKSALCAFFLTVCVFCWFALSALHTAWNGGSWSRPETVQEEPLFPEEEKRGVTNEVLASCESQTPEGIVVRLELIMSQGVYEKGKGYTGQCILRMRDEKENTLASLTLSQVFAKGGTQQFDEGLRLSVEDYNEDGVMEVSLGQRMEVSVSELTAPATASAVISKEAVVSQREKRTVYGYYLINVEAKRLRVVSEPVYVSDVTILQKGSMTFSNIEDTGGIISTEIEGETAYYVWNQKDKMYRHQNLTPEEIDARRAVSQPDTVSGETNAYSLENEEGKVVFRVATRTDEQGKPHIENVIINPRGVDDLKGNREITQFQGQYSDAAWVQGEEKQWRYALLTYIDAKGQSFVIFDVDKKMIYYQQESGSKLLEQVLSTFGEKEASFREGGMVVYGLMEMKEDDMLKISYAANADKEMTVRGSFQYNIRTKKASDLQYSQDRADEKQDSDAEEE